MQLWLFQHAGKTSIHGGFLRSSVRSSWWQHCWLIWCIWWYMYIAMPLGHTFRFYDKSVLKLWILFTGHGGSRAADYVQKNLFENLIKHPSFISDTTSAIGMKCGQVIVQHQRFNLMPMASSANAKELTQTHIFSGDISTNRFRVSESWEQSTT